MAMPFQAMTLPAFCGPTRPMPQPIAPVTIRLSPMASRMRPATRIHTDVVGASRKASEAR